MSRYTNKGDKGGQLKGPKHEKGGIPVFVRSTGENIEVEGGEIIINAAASEANCEILSKINQSAGNGVAFDCGKCTNCENHKNPDKKAVWGTLLKAAAMKHAEKKAASDASEKQKTDTYKDAHGGKEEWEIIAEQNAAKYKMKQGGQIPESFYKKYQNLTAVRNTIKKRYPKLDIAKGNGYHYWFSDDPELSLSLASLYSTSIFIASASHQTLGKWIADADEIMQKTESKAELGIVTEAGNQIELDLFAKQIEKRYVREADRILDTADKGIEQQRTELIKWIINSDNKVKVIIAFSGGKDSIAMVLQVIYDYLIPKSQIELWHHDVDGEGEQLFDWPCTKSYCQAFADAMGLPILYSYSEGGIVREIYRKNETRQPIYFQKEAGSEYYKVEPDKNPENFKDKMKFPAVVADLKTRWCSSIAKIEVMSKAINNIAEYKDANLVVLTGERKAESTPRSKYTEINPYRSHSKSKTKSGRTALSWRSILDWSDSQVWGIIEKYRIQPHPCYMLGWGRCSCQLCIFSSANTWAANKELAPEKVERIAAIENEIGHKLYNEVENGNKLGVYKAKVDKGKSFIIPETKARWAAEAMGEFKSPIFVDEWIKPNGYNSNEDCGAS